MAPKIPAGGAVSDLHTSTPKGERKSVQSALEAEKHKPTQTEVLPSHVPKRPNKSGGDSASQVKKRLEYERFLDWMALPFDARNPKTQKEFAAKNNLG